MRERPGVTAASKKPARSENGVSSSCSTRGAHRGLHAPRKKRLTMAVVKLVQPIIEMTQTPHRTQVMPRTWLAL